jgi:hypothetical protein
MRKSMIDSSSPAVNDLATVYCARERGGSRVEEKQTRERELTRHERPTIPRAFSLEDAGRNLQT